MDEFENYNLIELHFIYKDNIDFKSNSVGKCLQNLMVKLPN